jgi:PAS domain S-box-containing protein
MKQPIASVGQSIARQATATPRRAAIARYVLSLGSVAALFAIIPHTPLDGPVGGVLALLCVAVCCWFSGVGPALLMPLTIWTVSRFPFDDPTRAMLPSLQELMTFIGLTVLTGAVGLAGQSRRRLHAATAAHDDVIREQSHALNAAPIVFRDLDGRITTWTDGAQRLYGWSRDEALGRPVHELLQTGFPVPPETIRSALLSSRQWRGELTQVRKNGQCLNVTVHCILYARRGAALPGVAEIHSDVTDLRRAEAAIRDSDRRKDLFVATLAHELRNPLAPLRTGLDILRMRQSGPSPDGDVLEIMRRQLEHMVRMVDDLLDVSRINTGKVQLRLAPVAVSEVVRDAVAACRDQFETARHELTVSLPDADLYLHADAARLVQVLTNLLSNAAKFTDPGGTVRVTVTPEEGHVSIHVEDTGAGIPGESLPHVFDMFAQVDDPRIRGRGGLGLGLNIVRTLVELHGGVITAESDGPGRGAKFSVRLPLLDASAHERSGPRDALQTGSATADSRRVLIVDDNRDAAELLALMLTNLGFACRSAFDGPAALTMAEEFQPNAILLDLGMPGMNGLEVARRLRADKRF